MLDLNVKHIAEEIKSIKIQGASNIEKEAINVILNYIKKSSKKENEFLKELVENINHLIKQRPNEPRLRNSLNYILLRANKYKYEQTHQKLTEDVEKYYENTLEANKKVCEIASNLIQEGTKILTHCHSSLVENTLKIA